MNLKNSGEKEGGGPPFFLLFWINIELFRIILPFLKRVKFPFRERDIVYSMNKIWNGKHRHFSLNFRNVFFNWIVLSRR